jgi:hypothetical protein
MKILTASICLGLIGILYSYSNTFDGFKDGDIIFHRSLSQQSEMVKKVTGSNLTHCGIVFKKDDKFYVFEAVSPVKVTELNAWINRGQNKEYRVVRLKKELTQDQKKQIYSYARAQLGKPYDAKFQWSDSKIYCSELVWKAFKAAGIELCEVNKFSDYSITSRLAQLAIKKRYNNKVNWDEPVVAPIDLYNSGLVKTVY